MHQYNDLKTTWKGAEEDWLQPVETIEITQALTEQKLPENKNRKKNNCRDISSNNEKT